MARPVMTVGESFRSEKGGGEHGLDLETHGAASVVCFQLGQIAGLDDGVEVPEIGEEVQQGCFVLCYCESMLVAVERVLAFVLESHDFNNG